MSIKKIIRTIYNRNTIKIVTLIGIVGFFFILPTYAGDTTTNQLLKDTQGFLQIFLSLFSWLWIVLAILAGKLMTNDFVYGSIIHMDIYLWKIWNIMKNFANFALVGLVMVSIIQGIIGKKALDIKKTITNTLLAGILIQASRFMMGVLIDISTVATSAISAFPITFLKNDIGLQNAVSHGMAKFRQQRLIINPDATGRNNAITIQPELSILPDANRNNVLPNQNSVSGPFVYLGMSVFKFQNYPTTESTTGLTNLTLGFALRFFLLFLFTVGLVLLLIANIMRVGLLRVFIIGSPFLILIKIFDKKVGEGGGGLGKLFSVGNLIAIAFKPVIFVAGISLMLIVIVSMQKSIMGSGATRENDLNGVSLSVTGESTSVLNVQGISTVSINQKDILGKDVIPANVVGEVQNFFSQLIMLLLALFLMRRFIKLSLTLGGGPIEKTMENLTGLAEGMVKTLPVLPGGLSTNSAGSIMSETRRKTLGGFGLDKQGNFGEMQGKNFMSNESKFNDFVNDKMGLQQSWKQADYTKLNTLAKNGDAIDFFTTSKQLAKERNGGLSINNNTEWMKSLTLLLSKSNTVDNINTMLRNSSINKRFTGPFTGEAKNYFKGDNAEALYWAMGGTSAAQGTLAPRTFEELSKISFYPTK